MLTRHGRGVAVVLSLAVFEQLQLDLERVRLQRAVDDAERDVAAGHHLEGGEVRTKLKRWVGGKA